MPRTKGSKNRTKIDFEMCTQWGSQSVFILCSYQEQLSYFVLRCQTYSGLFIGFYRTAVRTAVRK